jgi:hypothetical protein
MSDIVGNLRTEIVESQQARIDLLKWKIILIAGLGAVGFGLAGKDATAMPVLLGFIPLVCAYVDVLCVHNDLRILVIAHFLRTHPSQTGAEARAYENLCATQRHTFALEEIALVGTTVTFSLLVALLGVAPGAWRMFSAGGGSLTVAASAFLVAASAIGLGVSVGASRFQKRRAASLVQLAAVSSSGAGGAAPRSPESAPQPRRRSALPL